MGPVRAVLLLALGTLTLLPASPARAKEGEKPRETAKAAAGPPAVKNAAGPEYDDPYIELLEELKQAEAIYDQGIEHFEKGRVYNGRAQLKRAFALLTSALYDEKLPLQLKEDFLDMIEKVRAWEARPDPVGEETHDLDITPAELSDAATGQTPGARVRKYTIPIDPDNPITKRYINVYTGKRKKSVEEALARSGRYRRMITRALARAGLPRELFYLVMTESEYKVHARSRAGAGGLWQFMPYTARKYGLEVSFWVDERYDPKKATTAAVKYLKTLHRWFGSWHLAMAAYNRGEHGLGRDLEFTRSADFSTASGRGGLPKETNNYVPKFMACVLIGEDPAAYGLHPQYESPEPYDEAALKKALDLEIAAKCAGVKKADIERLNPSLRAWCTPKNRPGFKLRIPQGSKQDFLKKLAEVKDWNPGPKFVRYRVRHGDYLGRIARKYRTTVRAIARLNKIRNPRLIRPGMILKVRPGKSFYRGK